MKATAAWMLVVLLGMAVSAAWAADQPATPAAAEEGRQAATDVAKKAHKGLLPDSAAKPADWFEWGADVRIRQEYLNNGIDVSDASDDTRHYMRMRERLWTKITPAADVEIGVRLVGEWKCWFEPDTDTRFDEYFLDKLYFKWDYVGGSPVSFKIGRDELSLGDKWLWNEATALDGTRTFFTDFAQFTVDLDGDRKAEKTKLDAIYFVQEGQHGNHLPVVNKRNRPIAEYDAQGAIVMLTHKAAKELGIEAYWSYYDLDKLAAYPRYARDYNAHLVGGRLFGEFESGFSYSANLAGQLGTRGPSTLNALGFLGEAKYTFAHQKKPEVHFQMEYLSGDKPASATGEDFVAHFGRIHAGWSEIYDYAVTRESGYGEMSNLLRFGFGTSVQCTEKTKARFDYNLLFANQNGPAAAGIPGFSADQNLRGNAFQARVDHKFNEWLSGCVMVEYFAPGDYYALPRDGAWFARWELLVSF